MSLTFDTAGHLLESIEGLLLKKPSNTDIQRFEQYSTFDHNNYIVKALPPHYCLGI